MESNDEGRVSSFGGRRRNDDETWVQKLRIERALFPHERGL